MSYPTRAEGLVNSIYELWTFYVHFTYSCMAMLHTYIYICIYVIYLLYFCQHVSTLNLPALKSILLRTILNIRMIIIIIMSRRQHGYPWPSLATSPYHSSPTAGLQGYILCPHIVAVCKFELVVLLLHGHMWGSIGVHHLWARPCFSSSVQRVWFV